MKMTPKQIKRALEDVNISQSGVARDLKVTPTAIQKVIDNTSVSHRIRCYIAKAINKPVEEIWDIKDPVKLGRPLTTGVYDHKAA